MGNAIDTSFRNCKCYALIDGTESYGGGIVGCSRDDCSYYNCTNFGNIKMKMNGSVFLATIDQTKTQEEPQLDSVPVQSPSKAEYTVGDTLDITGMTVTAYYSDGTSKDFTSLAACSPDTFNGSGTVTVTVSYTENGVTKTASFDVEVKMADAAYVVSLWNVDSDGVATFGSATGSNSLYLNHAHSDEGCIHTDSWETIKEMLKANPHYYDDCIKQGCTKNIPLDLNDTIFSGGPVSYEPSSVLYSSINENYRKYNSDTSVNDSESSNWATSRIRATLNGYDNRYAPFVPSSYAGVDCLTADNCLLSCFPKELQNIIVPRGYQAAARWSNINPYIINGSAKS